MKKNNSLIVPVERYNSTINEGLSPEQVNNRIKEKNVNVCEKKYSKSVLNIFFENIFSFFNLLGLIVTIALIIAKAKFSSFFFDVIFASNIIIGIVQELRAKITIDKLSLISLSTIKVIRNSETISIPSKNIVLDDVLYLGIGNQIPTDSIILDGNVEVNESLLTGESVAVKKQKGDELFAGSFIVSGTCYAKANKVGKENYVSKLSEKAKKYKKPHSEIMASLKAIIKVIGIVIIPFAGLYILKSQLADGDIFKAIQMTSSVVIGMIPSGMFLLTSVALAVGVIKLSKKNTLVQDLYSLEMLARVDTMCFDKTGTITDGRMSVKEFIKLDMNFNIPIEDIMSSMLNSLKDTNQTATALYERFGYNEKFKSTEVLHFNSEKKLSAVSFENIGTFAFGAPEFILDKKEYLKISHTVDGYAQMGLRVILLANSDAKIINDKLPNSFSPIALIILNDNIREEAYSTVKWFNDNDVDIKVISGDNPITVSEVAKRVGIKNADKFISLEGLNDQEVFEIANKYTVFGRVSPEQKAILLKSLKCAGHVTAMTGDGVNDILAMKEADCAVTVASGSDAARNVSNLVLTDNNFNSMPQIVYEGRRVINNIQSSSSLFLMKTLFTMLFSLVILCIPSITYYPFKLEQMIVLEVFIIGLPSFFLSFQPNDSRVSGKFIEYVLSRSFPCAILMVLSVFITKGAIMLFLKDISPELASTMEVFAIIFSGIINLVNICKPFNAYRTILFTAITTVIASIVIFTFLFGISIFNYQSFTPIGENIYAILIMFCSVLIEIPISLLLNRLCKKITLITKKIEENYKKQNEKNLSK